MKITLAARDSTVTTYNKELFPIGMPDVNFLNKLNSEVVRYPKKAKKLKRTLITTYSVFVSILVQYSVASASPTNVIPSDLSDSIMIAICVLAALGVGIATITLMLAGIWKMWLGKNRSAEWTIDILKGLGQVIFAPILVALIVGIFTLLFSNIPAFQPIKDPITIFFHQK